VCLLAVGIRAESSKNYKDSAEYQAYDAVAKDMAANNSAKALADLDTWQKNYPDSEFKDDRQLLYVQAYAAAKQPAKAIDTATSLLPKQDWEAANRLKLLFTTTVSIQQLASPTSEQLTTAEKAARQLLAYDQKPEGVAADAWSQARKQLQTAAKDALRYIAFLPGMQAMQKNDCATAETAFARALGDNPDNAHAAYELGRAQLCLYKAVPEKASPAIYEFARAASLDPANEPFFEKLFEQYHGQDPDGLRQLQELASKSPLPPAGFKIKSITEITDEKQAEFEKSNPQLALWMKIKGALADTNGEQYFTSNLQGAEVPQLKGVLVGARPLCQPKELLVSVPMPDAPQPLQAEILLKLDKPMTGRPEANAEFHWIGVPAAFTKTPFLLTMDAEVDRLDGLKTTPCTVVRKKK
jgi:hypothetical protein